MNQMRILDLMKHWQVNSRTAKQWLKKELSDHVINATAINLAANALWGSYERFALGKTAEEVMRIRLDGTLITYAGLSYPWSKGHDYVQRKVKNASPLVQALADGAYSFCFNIPVCGFLYRNSEHPVRDTFIGAAVSIPFGIMIGYAKDFGRDYIGKEKCDRLPAMLELSPQNKTRAAGAFALSSVVYTAALCAVK